MKRTFSVTIEDIELARDKLNGKHYGETNVEMVCPVAQALMRNGFIKVKVGSYQFSAIGPDGMVYAETELPTEAQLAIDKFDNYNTMEPFEFTIML